MSNVVRTLVFLFLMCIGLSASIPSFAFEAAPSLWLRADSGVLEESERISQWSDQTLNTNAVQTVDTERPRTSTEMYNFQPALRFDQAAPGISRTSFDVQNWENLPQGDTGRAYFLVTNPDTSQRLRPHALFSQGVQTYYLNATDGQFVGLSPTSTDGFVIGAGGHSLANGVVTTEHSIFSISLPAAATSDEFALAVDGLNTPLTTKGGNPTPIDTSIARAARLGFSENGSGYSYSGDVSEIITVNTQLSSSGQNQIETYLALKYGITLEQEAAVNNYVNSAGNAVWVNTGDGYRYRVFGLARDDTYGLDQRVSRSAEVDSVLTLSLDPDFTLANSAPERTTQHANDLQGLVLSDDNAALNTQTDELETERFLARIGREWRVSRSIDFDASVHMQFAGFDDTYVLLGDDDGDFTAGAEVITTLSPNGEAYDIDLSDQSFLTLAQPDPTYSPFDNDGVGEDVEAAAPNNGDGNGDGVPDNEQNDVASLPALDGSYLTIDGLGCAFDGVLITEGSEEEFAYPLGLLNFTADCATMDLEVIAHNNLRFEPRQCQGEGFVPIANVTTETDLLAGNAVTRLGYSLADGGELDAQTGPDAQITHCVGFAVPRPTATEEATGDNVSSESKESLALIRTGGQ